MGDRDGKYYLNEIVEMDEAFFGGPSEGGKRGRGTEKTPAVIAMSLDKEGCPEYVKMQVVENIDGATIVEVAKETITPGATISTDGLSVYNALSEAGYEHQSVHNWDIPRIG